MNVPPPTMNVPAGSERAAGLGGPPPRRRRSSGVVSLSIGDVTGGGTNESPAEPPENGNKNSNSSFGGGMGGMIKIKQMKMTRPTAAKGKSLRNIMSGLNRVKSKRGGGKFADAEDDENDQGHEGGLLSTAEGEAATSIKSGRGNKPSLSKVSKLSKGTSLRNITGKMNKNREEKTLTDLIERQSWRKVLSRLKTEEGRREVVASLLSGEASTTPVPSVSNNISDDGTEGGSLSSKTVHKNTVADETEDAADSNSGAKQKRGSKKQQNVLHLAVRCRAPPSILASLLDVCPSLIVESDSLRGGTALHVAASFEARPYRHDEDVVGFLLGANPSAVWARDELGRLPLHLACMSSDDLLEPPSGTGDTDPDDITDDINYIASDIMAMLSGTLDARSVSAIISRAPPVLLAEDDRGYIPAEYAAESGADSSSSERMTVLEGLLEEVEMEWHEKGLRSDKTGKKQGGGGGASYTDEDEIEDDSEGGGVEAEYERWLGRRTPRFRRALEEHQRRQRRRRRNGKDKNCRRADEEEVADRMMDMGIALFLGLASDEGGGLAKEGRWANEHRDKDSKVKDPEKRPCHQPALPKYVTVDLQQGDEWLEDELEVEFEGAECDEGS